MSTSNQALVLTGLYAWKIARETGLTERAIESLHPDYFGSPGHFKFMSGVQGGMFYTAKGVVGLIEALRVAGRVVESRVLLDIAQPRHPVSLGWAQRWEAQSL